MSTADLFKIFGGALLASALAAGGSVFVMKTDIAVIKNDITHIQQEIGRLRTWSSKR